jgi:ribosomal protein S18 acetylase RimI-like enzyme
VQVRPATVHDAQALAVVRVRSWQATYRGQVPQEYLDALDPIQGRPAWEQWIQSDRPPAGTLVLHHPIDGVIGYVHVSPSRDPDTDPLTVGEVQAIYLLPEYWGQGIGKMLMNAGLRRLAEAGYREADLWVLETNHRARRFYEATGWHPDGTVKSDDSRGFPLIEVRYHYRAAA